MPSKSPIQLVCFDLGGVLVRIACGWDDACRLAGVELRYAEQAWTRHHDLLVRYETGQIDDAGYLEEAPRLVGGGVTKDMLANIFDAYTREMYPGTAELIDELKSRDVKTACLSNTNGRHWKTLSQADRYRPLARLDYKFASHELGVIKPNEPAYRRVEAATGFWGEQVLFFDDRAENVAGARAVNWKAELVDSVDDTIPQIREYLVAHGVL